MKLTETKLRSIIQEELSKRKVQQAIRGSSLKDITISGDHLLMDFIVDSAEAREAVDGSNSFELKVEMNRYSVNPLP